MLKFFKKKSEKEKLQAEYEKLMSEWHRVSQFNRGEADEIYAKAEAVANKIAELVD